MPEEIQIRYQQLREKLIAEQITEIEHKELLQLTPLVEAKAVERLAHMSELAKLWKTTVDEVMNRLDIKPPSPIHA